MTEKLEQEEYISLIREWRINPSDEAWEKIWVALFPYLKKCASVVFSRDDDQHDIASDTFIRIMSGLHKYDPKRNAKFTTWVYRICRNACVDKIRKSEPNQLDDSMADLIPGKTSEEFLTVDDLTTMHGYIQFKISDDTLRDVGRVYMRHNGKTGEVTSSEMKSILELGKVRWQRYGKIDDITAFLFGLLRLAKHTEEDHLRLVSSARGFRQNSPVGLLSNFVSTADLCLILLLFGGTNLPIPTPGAVIKHADKLKS